VKIRNAIHPLAAGLMLLLAAAGCKTAGEYVTADDLPAVPAAADREYVIQPGDTIGVRVWGQDNLATRGKVRPDGKISIPFVNDVQAAGSTPAALAKKIQAGLKDFLVNPVVTVTLEEPRALQVSVLGEVARPGTFVLDQNAGVLQAIAMAGGMTPFANKDAIMVIRQRADGGNPQRIRFSYDGLTQLRGRSAAFRLQGGDVLVVE
jgi:polysaccharide export outer membrane protein